MRNKLNCTELFIKIFRVSHCGKQELLHRAASSIIEAERFKAENALILVHSFSQDNEGFDDYCQFLDLFDLRGEIDSLAFAKSIHGIDLYFGWVKGEEKYLDK
jgi:hypothetical protein